MRSFWSSLDGPWDFAYDDADVGLDAGWSNGLRTVQRITVPFPPESEASGVADTGFHPVVWYQRTLTTAELKSAGHGADSARLLLHFGAVDYRARVWLNGHFLGEHVGGHTPFSVEATAALEPAEGQTLVVRAEDRPGDQSQPRGKQDWHREPHGIWYRRTTGIWQSVWLEAVPEVSVEKLMWLPHGPHELSLTIRLRGNASPGSRLRVALRSEDLDEELGTTEITLPAPGSPIRVPIHVARQRHGQAADELYWTPQRPRLIDAVVTLLNEAGEQADAVASYVGMRTISLTQGAFMLNGRPLDVRSVLNQGFWPTSHLAAPSPEALRKEVELIRELGFNSARNHQKIEDPRFLYWADRLGLMIWGEAPAQYEFSQQAVTRFTSEWIEAVERDISHPCLVTWVPHNESWGIEHLSEDSSEQAYARAVVDLTRALDPSRPVICNDGWEQQNTDIITVHDYSGDAERLAQTYGSDAARERIMTRLAPSGHPQFVAGFRDEGQPVMLTEFGGTSYQPQGKREDGWGYTIAEDGEEWLHHVNALYEAIRSSSFLAGTCWTQLTDTDQETNGLLTETREPKMPIARIRRAVTGKDDSSAVARHL